MRPAPPAGKGRTAEKDCGHAAHEATCQGAPAPNDARAADRRAGPQWEGRAPGGLVGLLPTLCPGRCFPPQRQGTNEFVYMDVVENFKLHASAPPRESGLALRGRLGLPGGRHWRQLRAGRAGRSPGFLSSFCSGPERAGHARQGLCGAGLAAGPGVAPGVAGLRSQRSRLRRPAWAGTGQWPRWSELDTPWGPGEATATGEGTSSPGRQRAACRFPRGPPGRSGRALGDTSGCGLCPAGVVPRPPTGRAGSGLLGSSRWCDLQAHHCPG